MRRRILNWSRAESLCWVLLLAAGCQMTQPTDIPRERMSPPEVSVLRVKPGDAMRVTFPGAPSLSFEQIVRPDGKISLPESEQMEWDVEGKRPSEVELELTEIYGPSLTYKEVDVILQSSPDSVRIAAPVLRPGPIPISGPTTALQAVMDAGGVIEGEAKLDQVRVTALENGEWRTYVLDLNKAMAPGGGAQPFYLRPGDSIVVPRKKSTLF